MNLESGNMAPRKGPTMATISRVAAAVLALMSAIGCNKAEGPDEWATYDKAKACATDPARVPDLAASCKDRAGLVEKVLSSLECRLPDRNAISNKGDTTAAIAASAVTDVCDKQGQ